MPLFKKKKEKEKIADTYKLWILNGKFIDGSLLYRLRKLIDLTLKRKLTSSKNEPRFVDLNNCPFDKIKGIHYKLL